jgi:hypothetical protein
VGGGLLHSTVRGPDTLPFFPIKIIVDQCQAFDRFVSVGNSICRYETETEDVYLTRLTQQ